MPKGVPNKKYSGEFKQNVIETMHKEHMSCKEAEREFQLSHNRAAHWGRIYLEEGPEVCMWSVVDETAQDDRQSK